MANPNKTVEEQIVGSSLPAHVMATFKGTYYKGAGSHSELIPFTAEVAIPQQWVEDDGHHPVSLFVNYFAESLFKDTTGYSKIHHVRLASTGPLPEMDATHELRWTADYKKLVKIAERTKVGFIPLDPKEGTPLKQKHAVVRPELYPDTHSLRTAILRCIQEPQAFEQEQIKRAASKVVEHKKMADQLDQLSSLSKLL